MNVLFLTTNIGYGGASKMISSVANSLCKDHNVKILTFRQSEIKQIFDNKVMIEHNKLYVNRFKPIELIGQIIRLRKYIKVNNIDLIIAFLHPSNFMAVLATMGTRTKVLLSERGDPISRRKNGNFYVHLVERILYKADAYVFQSEGAKKAYPSKCQVKSEIIFNSIPQKIYPQYCPSEEKYILCAARIELVQKRQDVLVEAFNKFLVGHKNYHLYLAGDGPDMNILKNRIDSLGIQDHVNLLGARKDVLDLMAKSTFFVLSSDYEGLPNVLLEAVAVGVPCISTDCSPGGARMIIEDGKNGFIVPCRDSDKLCERMIELADNSDLRMLFSNRIKSVSSKFEEAIVDTKWRDFVNKILS